MPRPGRCSFAAAWVVVGCAHPPPDGHSGRDRDPDRARVVDVPSQRPHTAVQRGKVSTAAGDRTDWIYVRLPDMGGGPVAVDLSWEPRGDDAANVTVALYTADGTPLGDVRTQRADAISARIDAPPTLTGFYVVVQAAGWDDGVKYRLSVEHDPARPAPQDIELLEDLPGVPSAADADASERVWEPGPEPCSPEWFRRGGTCNPPPPPPEERPQPPDSPESPDPAVTRVTALIIDLREDGAGTAITLSRGSDHGVAKGWRGTIAGLRGTLTISSVSANSARARVEASVDEVKATGLRVVLRAPGGN